MINETQYLEVFKAIPTPCLILLPNKPLFTIVDVNDTYLALTSTTREQLIGKNFFDVSPRNPYPSATVWEAIFDEVLRTKKPHRSMPQQYALPLAGSPAYMDVKYVEIINTPVLNDQGEVTAIIRSITDVTDTVYHEKFLEETQQVARMGSWQANITQQTITWSAGMRDIYEVDPDYVPDFDSALAFFTSEGARAEIKQALEKVMHDGGIFRVTLPIVTVKGNERWLFIVGKADLVNGTRVRIYGISQDITEKKNTEKALISSQYDFQNLVETVDGIVWEADADTLQAKFVSHKVEEILGYNAEEWLADSGFWPKHIYEADREYAVNFCHQQTQKLANHTFDYRMVKKNGDIIWVKDIVSVISKSGKPCWLRGVIVDITDAKLAELKLKSLHEQLALHLKVVEESEQKYSDLFHLSPLPMWVYDMETYRFLDVNTAAIAHYGYTHEEFLSMTIMDIRPPGEIPKVETDIALSIQHDELFNKSIYIHRKKNGEIIEVEVQSNIINFHGRKAEVILAHDITDKLYYIHAIETQNKKLQEIAWMQSHLVRAPLARIMGLIDLTQHVPESGIENSELLAAINSSAIELDNVLRNITDKAEQINLARYKNN